MSTVCSNVLPSVSMITASSAARSGATARLRSRSSRSRSSARTASASSPAGSRPRSSMRRAGPLLDRGVEEQLEVRVGQHDRADVAARRRRSRRRSASARWRWRRAARTSAWRETADTAASTSGPRAAAVVSVPSTQDRRQAPRAVVRRARPRSTSATRPAASSVAIPAREGEPGERAVQQARVAEPAARAGGPRRRRRCSCRWTPDRRARRRSAARRRPSGRGIAIGTSWRARPWPEDTRPVRGLIALSRDRSAASRRTSAAVSGRTSPLARSSRRSVPIRTRTSRSTGAPTVAEHPPELALPALVERRPRYPGRAADRRPARASRRAAGPRSSSGRAGRSPSRRPRRARCPSRAPPPARGSAGARARPRTRARPRSADGARARPSRRRW